MNTHSKHCIHQVPWVHLSKHASTQVWFANSKGATFSAAICNNRSGVIATPCDNCPLQFKDSLLLLPWSNLFIWRDPMHPRGSPHINEIFFPWVTLSFQWENTFFCHKKAFPRGKFVPPSPTRSRPRSTPLVFRETYWEGRRLWICFVYHLYLHLWGAVLSWLFSCHSRPQIPTWSSQQELMFGNLHSSFFHAHGTCSSNSWRFPYHTVLHFYGDLCLK